MVTTKVAAAGVNPEYESREPRTGERRWGGKLSIAAEVEVLTADDDDDCA